MSTHLTSLQRPDLVVPQVATFAPYRAPAVARAPHPDAPLGKFLTGVPHLESIRRRVMRPVTPTVYVDHQGRVWRIPERFYTDGCSIPDVAQHLLGFDPWLPETLRQGILHDMFCCTHFLGFTETSLIFRQALGSFASARLYWRAVSSPAGWYSYNFTPDLPENLSVLEEMKLAWEQDGVEYWTPETEPQGVVE